MPGSIEMRNIAGGSRRLLARGSLVLIGWMALVGAGVAADPPTLKAPTLSDANRKKLLADRDRFEKESTALHAQGKYVEAIAAAQKMLAIERQVFGDVADDVAGSLDQIARCHFERENFEAARTALKEELSICSKLHGDGDWRVTDARLALRDVAIRAGMTPGQRRCATTFARALTVNAAPRKCRGFHR